MKEKIFYIGFNANNAICNAKFFDGSITLYPTGEKGNIYYSNKLIDDTTSIIFMEKYKNFIYNAVMNIQNKNKNVKFLCFNEKIRLMCNQMPDINLVLDNDLNLISFLNNKIAVRNAFKDLVPMLQYKYYNTNELSYEHFVNDFGIGSFVVQGEKGSGGNTTYLINNEKDLDLIDREGKYSVSKYISHLPLNITLIIGVDKIIYFPISVQLILLTNKKFKYVGGDFFCEKYITKENEKKIYRYSKKIAENIRLLGYKGILGIDFLLTAQNQIVFMEVNPRFQASSFLLSLELEKKYGMDIAELHYLAISNKKLKNISLEHVNKSFVNCNRENEFNNLKDYIVLKNGYFSDNVSSIYRKIYNRSILHEEGFEQYKILK